MTGQGCKMTYIKKREKEAVLYYWLRPILKDEQVMDCKIVKSYFLDRLADAGYARLDVQGIPILCRIEDNRVKQVTITEVTDYWFNEVIGTMPEKLENGVTKDMAREKSLNMLEALFKEKLLHQISHPEGTQFIQHTKDEAFFFFQNQWLKVNRAGISINHSYDNIQGLVWQDEILPHEFTRVYNWRDYNFYRFIENVCGNLPERVETLMSYIGYLLHHYFEYKVKLILLTDSKISDDPEGRTGKGIIGEFIKWTLNANHNDPSCQVYCDISGKSFNENEERKYSKVNLNTKVIHLNDIEHRGYGKFDIEKRFVEIMGGFHIRKMYQDPFYVKAKLLVSSNRTLKLSGGSSRDRIVEFEMSDHYNEHFSPFDEFGEWFGRDWDQVTWNAFYNFMMECVVSFFKNGLKQATSINLERRKLHEHTCPEFIEYIYEENGLRYRADERYDKQVEIDRFKAEFPDYHNLTSKRFTGWLKLMAEYLPEFEKFDEKHKAINEPRSNSKGYIIFRKAGSTHWLPGKQQNLL